MRSERQVLRTVANKSQFSGQATASSLLYSLDLGEIDGCEQTGSPALQLGG